MVGSRFEKRRLGILPCFCSVSASQKGGESSARIVTRSFFTFGAKMVSRTAKIDGFRHARVFWPRLPDFVRPRPFGGICPATRSDPGYLGISSFDPSALSIELHLKSFSEADFLGPVSGAIQRPIYPIFNQNPWLAAPARRRSRILGIPKACPDRVTHRITFKILYKA